MSIVITGATGQLGSLVVERLLADGTWAGDITATGRDTARLEPLAARGVIARQADLTDPAQLAAAFKGAERVLLVSSTDLEARFDNHRRAIDAAGAAGVAQLAYVSMINATSARNRLAVEHRRTEEYLIGSGVPFVLMRNGWYLENYTVQLPQILAHGLLLGSGGDGKVSAASRRDYADAAAAVLTSDGHTGATYELGGEPFTLADLAATISREAGSQVSYQDLTESAFADALTQAGLPPELARVLAGVDTGLAGGELYTDSVDLARLIGRSPTIRQEAVRAALARKAA